MEVAIAVSPRKRNRTPKRARVRMNVAEVASYLGRHENTVRLWVKLRKIPVVRLNGRFEFDKATIDRWIAAHTRAAE